MTVTIRTQHGLEPSGDEVLPTIETLLREESRQYAVELRKLAYILPNGVGELALLRLSESMTVTTDQPLTSLRARRYPTGFTR